MTTDRNTDPALRVLTLGAFLADYQKRALTTMVELPPIQHLMHCVTGLAEESGELLGLYKKVAFFGHALDRTKLIGELGDQLYYAVALIDAFNLQIEEVMQLETLHDLLEVVAQGRAEFVSQVRSDDAASLLRPQVFMVLTAAADVLNHANNLAIAWAGGEEPDEETAAQLGEAMRCIVAIIGIVSSIAHDVLGVSIEDVANANLAKLAARYPGGKFDQAASLNRNAAAEQAALAG